MRRSQCLSHGIRRKNVVVSASRQSVGVKDAKRALYKAAAQADGVFSIEQARRCGMTENQISRCRLLEWTTLYDGVYLAPGAPLTWRGRVRAACLAGAPHAVVSHRSAAAFYDVPGGNRAVVEVTTPRWSRTKHPELVVHERSLVLPGDTQLIDGIPVTRPELVAIQLAAIYRSADFVERVFHAMRRKRLITIESMGSMLRRHARRGVPGIRVTRAALDRWNALQRPTESEMETKLLQILRRAGLPDLVPQYEIYDGAGRFVARLDIGIPSYKIGVEYESDAYHLDEFSIARDDRRRNEIYATGWIVVKARRQDVRNGAVEVVRAVRAHIPAPGTMLRAPDSAQVSRVTA